MKGELMSDVLEINFQKIEGHVCYAPYVPASVKGGSGVFQMRIDTGADISCVPADAVTGMKFPDGRELRICAGATGDLTKPLPKIMAICIHNGDDTWSFRPSRGVLITKSDVGLLGMDILGQLSMLMIDDTIILERRGNE